MPYREDTEGLARKNAELQTEIDALKKRIAELEEELAERNEDNRVAVLTRKLEELREENERLRNPDPPDTDADSLIETIVKIDRLISDE